MLRIPALCVHGQAQGGLPLPPFAHQRSAPSRQPGRWLPINWTRYQRYICCAQPKQLTLSTQHHMPPLQCQQLRLPLETTLATLQPATPAKARACPGP